MSNIIASLALRAPKKHTLRYIANTAIDGGLVVVMLVLAVTAGLWIMQTYRMPWHITVNLTASMPRGLFHVTPLHRAYTRGDIVVSEQNARAREIGCAEKKQTFLKRVIAEPGDRVCLKREGRLEVKPSGVIYTYEPKEGAPDLAYVGCRRVPARHLFIATPHPRSCDSRYFGFIPEDLVLGVASPIVTIDSKH